MTYSEKLKQVTIKEWRELGFYYDHNDKNLWQIVGSKQGILNFCKILDEYILNEKKVGISEHEHYGPYSYLKIMTWDKPIINSGAIGGSFSDLKRLSDLIKTKLSSLNVPSEFEIGKEYDGQGQWKIGFKVKESNFDPASMDEELKK